ncbi:WhiB family transcriptional regulator [Saccharopolyspora sp. 6M]|uniref:WhiB family transcriptional regulator n=1 Tax=unclassified Saccharopolyspora TaxID=2646250 RepID=UPI0035AB86C4
MRIVDGEPVAEDRQPDWYQSGLCAQTDPDAFFPEQGQSGTAAKRICGTCPVREACLEHSLLHDERYGIWGGLGEADRRKLRAAVRSGSDLRASRGGAAIWRQHVA